MPVVLLMAAGAMLFGGAGLYTEARRREGLREAKIFREAELDALRDAESIIELRRRVREAGGDPDEAVAALRALQARQTSVAEVERFLQVMGV